MDAGRPEAFLSLLKVIEEHQLIRYSSVKRAVSTWIGICDEHNLDRISDKLLNQMGQCLRDETYCQNALASNDSIAISCALWAKGFYHAPDAVAAVGELIRTGTKNQRLTASYFNQSLGNNKLKHQAVKEVIQNHSDDLELVAAFLPSFMGDLRSEMWELLKDEKNQSGYRPDTEAVKPKPFPVIKYFSDAAEARQYFHKLYDIFKQVPKKGLEYKPCIFPWYQVHLSQSDLVLRMCMISWMLQEEELLIEATRLIPFIEPNTRNLAVRILLYQPKTEEQREILLELLRNPEAYTRNAAYSLVKVMELGPRDYEQLEDNLRYKAGRKECLTFLKQQSAKALSHSINRLLTVKSEESRMGALDLALELKKSGDEAFQKVRPLLQEMVEPTGREQVLLAELLEATSAAQDILNTPGYGLYNPNCEFIVPPLTINKNAARQLLKLNSKDCRHILQQLDQVVAENRHLEYQDRWGEEVLLGNKLVLCKNTSDQTANGTEVKYPFSELWDSFYHSVIQTPERLLQVYFYMQCHKRQEEYTQNAAVYKHVFGTGLIKKVPFSDFELTLTYGAQVFTVINFFILSFVSDKLKGTWGLAIMAGLLAELKTSGGHYEKIEKRWNGDTRRVTKRIADLPIFQECRNWITMEGIADEDWSQAFSIMFPIDQMYRSDKESGYLSLYHYVQCYLRGIWRKDLLYKAVFEFLSLSELLKPISIVAQKGPVSAMKARIRDLDRFFGRNVFTPIEGKYYFDQFDANNPAMKLAHELYQELIPMILTVELKRGEQETPFSSAMTSIQVVYGIDVMVQILTALGKEKLDRKSYYWGCSTDRRTVLCHLLRVCYPKPEETAADLKMALKGTDINKKRLIELAMYSQQWIPLLQEYLQMPGLQCGCYYFIAHTGERHDEYTTAMIARYTPATVEELRDGVFDMNWFFEAYQQLGEKDFKVLYDAAKYSASGSAHARARKYADAALGAVNEDDLKAQITVKRNKDLLMSLGLLPLTKKRTAAEKEMLERYQLIEKFRKESKSFGAQRRASEGRACDIALHNLSNNAGFSDVTRLILRMENRLSESLQEYFIWQPVEDMELQIALNKTGKCTLQCQKNGKLLKSIPAKYKKHETVLKYQEIVKKLKEQFRRTKQMMEQAMEDQTTFEVWEYQELVKNPVLNSIVAPLVLKLDLQTAQDRTCSILGFMTEEGLQDWSGHVTPVKPENLVLIAHPFDLYEEGHWHEYQKLLFEQEMRQPFKQVFRELYRKLEEELDKDNSRMFAGNQIQPKKTVGALRSRRWVADYEEGLQKVYYKENIVACIYAMADWFSPSDIEAPTLEWVVFYDRKTFKRLKIRELPDVLYSEVMRDVDLAVSVAHAGGVDPETSHSTIEMRRSIIACSLELFKINNVRLEANHAFIQGKLGEYTVHLGSGVVHQTGNSMLFVVPVHSQHRGRIFLPFIDDDPKTAEILSKIILFAEDTKIKDPNIISQIK